MKALRGKGCPGRHARTASLSGSASVINGKGVGESACRAARSTAIAALISAADRASSGWAERDAAPPVVLDSNAASRYAARTRRSHEPPAARSDAVVLLRHIAVGIV